MLAVLSVLFGSSSPGLAQAACGWRADPACHPGVSWPDLRSACAREADAYKASDPRGYSWFLNAGNGFVGVPFLLQAVLPDLAPEIGGPTDQRSAKFGLFMDPDQPARPLPRGLGIASAAGRPAPASAPPLAEIDFDQPGPHTVTLACGSCHSGQVRAGDAVLTFGGAPNTQFDVRKWREAFDRTVQNYLANDAQIAAAAQRVAAIIDAKPPGFIAWLLLHHPQDVPILLHFPNQIQDSPLAARYRSQVPHAFGDRVCRYAVTPDAGNLIAPPRHRNPDYLQAAMVEHLTRQGRPARFDFVVQVRDNAGPAPSPNPRNRSTRP